MNTGIPLPISNPRTLTIQRPLVAGTETRDFVCPVIHRTPTQVVVDTPRYLIPSGWDRYTFRYLRVDRRTGEILGPMKEYGRVLATEEKPPSCTPEEEAISQRMAPFWKAVEPEQVDKECCICGEDALTRGTPGQAMACRRRECVNLAGVLYHYHQPDLAKVLRHIEAAEQAGVTFTPWTQKRRKRGGGRVPTTSSPIGWARSSASTARAWTRSSRCPLGKT